jgi:polyhydroxybutyrate depolymerase
VPATPGRSTNSNSVLILSGGYERTYRVHVPLTAPQGPRPLIIALHSGGGTPSGMEYGIGLDSAADRAGIYVVYPEGIGGFWNNGRPSSVVHSGGVNDYQFVLDTLADAERRNDIDPNRVFIAGQGDGAALALQIAARYPDVFAGVVAVSGQFILAPSVPMPTVPISVVFIHGTEDPYYPVAGVPDPKQGPIDSLAHTVNTYVALDHAGAPQTKQLPDRAPLDATTITETTWTPGPQGYTVTLYTVQGGGSPWPGGSVNTRDLVQNGRTSQSLDASGVVEHFALDTKRVTPASPIPAATPSSTTYNSG